MARIEVRSADYHWSPAPEGQVAFPPDCRLGQIAVEFRKDYHDVVSIGTEDLAAATTLWAGLRDKVAAISGRTDAEGPVVEYVVDEVLALFDEMVDSSIGQGSVWITLDRDGCNRLIKGVRRGRDAVFGKDE